ncbi:pre-mRNA splicing factor [Pseudozyma hubeiensis SY62]|uniref:Pre-mRNA splicing factor n=1 Tax=Pseudozyma hubeiensis (strain SY62) TaxID=1305764 RepID=R9NYD6_PSEHS|nr:pre-mRNA splicing factor [Pseudozyma hubeiensis SY62]GAC93704.1 pre-mRNA splicing factor [Pseudozyma hubeiensis SY62]
MVANAESSKFSVNERLARAREEDLRRCRNIQAKLARAQLHDAHEPPLALGSAATPPKMHHSIPVHVTSSSSRTGLMFMSSTEQAQRERDQRSRERQLKRQVAGPIPPESWRDDFDRLSIRKGVASHFDWQRLQDLVSSVGREGEEGSGSRVGSDVDRVGRRGVREVHGATCAGLRWMYDGEGAQEGSKTMLGLRDMTLCVIADALNRPHRGKGKERNAFGEMNRSQLREVLEYLPIHMQQRMLTLCGRLAATEWPLSEWTAQAMIELHTRRTTEPDINDERQPGEAEDDWETSFDPDRHPTNHLPSTPSEGSTALDLSFSTTSSKTITRMLSTFCTGPSGTSLRMLSLAGTVSLDTPAMHAIFARLPNLTALSLAGSQLSSATADESEREDHQRAAVFLRKLSRSLGKLEMLDLSWCGWVCADAVQAVSWANRTMVAWPRLGRLLLTGCPAVTDPREGEKRRQTTFDGKAAGNYVGQWHARHSQRPTETSHASIPAGALYDAYTDTLHRDPFDLFSTATPTPRTSTRATFGDYTNNVIQPAIITHMTPSSNNDGGSAATLMEYVRCPRSAGKVEMWQWQRVRILQALRGRSQPFSRSRSWIEVYF